MFPLCHLWTWRAVILPHAQRPSASEDKCQVLCSASHTIFSWACMTAGSALHALSPHAHTGSSHVGAPLRVLWGSCTFFLCLHNWPCPAYPELWSYACCMRPKTRREGRSWSRIWGLCHLVYPPRKHHVQWQPCHSTSCDRRISWPDIPVCLFVLAESSVQIEPPSLPSYIKSLGEKNK